MTFPGCGNFSCHGDFRSIIYWSEGYTTLRIKSAPLLLIVVLLGVASSNEAR